MSAHGRLGKSLLSASGHYRRRLASRTFPGVAVLCYHGIRRDSWPARTMVFEGLHVTATELDAHCRFLRESCTPISLEIWRASIADGRPLPPRPVLVTFDDGYRSVFTIGRPILARHGIPAVLFLSSDPIEHRRLAWYDAIALEQGEAMVAEMKRLDADLWAARCIAHSTTAREGDPHEPLRVEEVQELAAVPDIEIGGHSAGHPILAMAGIAEQRRQIQCNKQRLEAWIGTRVTAFAYPNGRRGEDYTSDTVAIVRECGFDAAFTTNQGFAIPDEPPLERSRFVMLAGLSAAELGHLLAYSWLRAPLA
jgi:peptidoglycan/xylan/chitin deacetylase (PgdA/CDA1 family)